MTVTTAINGGYLPSELRRLPTTFSHRTTSPRPPIFVSTNVNDVNLHSLRDLFTLCDHSCLRYDRKQPVDLRKLRIALSHSSIVVSVFAKPEAVRFSSGSSSDSVNSSSFGDLIGKISPVTASNGELVGFGRAVSDHGLTASIYDIMVMPSLRGMGIGGTIVQRIIRALTNRGIYDIAALCSAKERSFFEACGFGDDILGSTTMMYTRAGSTCKQSQMAKLKSIAQELLLPRPAGDTFDS